MAGSAVILSGPALTTGARFFGFTCVVAWTERSAYRFDRASVQRSKALAVRSASGCVSGGVKLSVRLAEPPAGMTLLAGCCTLLLGSVTARSNDGAAACPLFVNVIEYVLGSPDSDFAGAVIVIARIGTTSSVDVCCETGP